MYFVLFLRILTLYENCLFSIYITAEMFRSSHDDEVLLDINRSFYLYISTLTTIRMKTAAIFVVALLVLVADAHPTKGGRKRGHDDRDIDSVARYNGEYMRKGKGVFYFP